MRSQACFACSFTKFRVREKYFQAHAGKSDTSTVFCPTEAYPVPPTLLPSAGCGLPCIWLPAGRRCRSRRRVPGCSRAWAASLAAAPPPGTPPPWCRPRRTSGRTSCLKRCGGLHAESWRDSFWKSALARSGAGNFRCNTPCKENDVHVPQFLVLFALGPNVDNNGVNPLSNQALDTLQSQLQQTVPVLWKRQQKVF